jgi:methenyltetrahydromethanopterin cyclohydrolase
MSLNFEAYRLLERVLEDASSYDFGSVRVLDVGVNAPLSDDDAWDVAMSVAEACLGCLGKVSVGDGMLSVEIPENPAFACLGSQMSGWAVKVGGKTALGSGPARILARKPRELYSRLGYSESSEKAVLCLESEVLPDEKTCWEILNATAAEKLLIAAYRPDSVVGLVQVLARVVEMGVYRLDFLGFDARRIVSAKGSVPVPKLDAYVMYSANDAIIYGGLVELSVSGWDVGLTDKCVSSSSPAYGKPFKEIFRKAGGDFYKIDHAIFAPAEIRITDESSGKTYTAGMRKWLRK